MTELRSASTRGAALAYVTQRVAGGEYMPKTAAAVRETLMLFADVIGDPPASKINRRHIGKWLEVPAAAATRRQRFSNARLLCRWLVSERVLARDPFEGMKAPREPRRLPRALAKDDVTRAIRAAGADRRITLVLLLMVQEGLRCVEVARLETGDIDTGERTLEIRGKGGHERLLPVSDETWAALLAYQAETPAGTGPLIKSRNDIHKGVTSDHISTMVARFMANAGVKGSPLDGRGAHALRHTFATDALRHGAHLRDLQAALGHASLQTTERYLSREVKGLREAMGGRSYTAGATS